MYNWADSCLTDCNIINDNQYGLKQICNIQGSNLFNTYNINELD